MPSSPRNRPGTVRRGQVRAHSAEERCWRVAIWVAVALTLAPMASGDDGPRPDEPQRMLLGLVVDNRERRGAASTC